MSKPSEKERRGQISALETELSNLKKRSEAVKANINSIHSTAPSVLLEQFIEALEYIAAEERARDGHKAQQCGQIAMLLRRATIGEGHTKLLLEHIKELEPIAWR